MHYEKITLYLGTRRAGQVYDERSRFVRDSSTQRFIEAEISARWGEGFTIQRGNGQWRSDAQGNVSEPVYVVTRFVAGSNVDEERDHARAIAGLWKRFADQESVLMTVEPVDAVEFV